MHRILMATRYGFRTMTPEDYLHNQRDASLARSAHRKVLKPLENANQGDILVTDEVQLVGVPKGEPKIKYGMDPFKRLLLEGEKDLIFLQIDPSSYIAR